MIALVCEHGYHPKSGNRCTYITTYSEKSLREIVSTAKATGGYTCPVCRSLVRLKIKRLQQRSPVV